MATNPEATAAIIMSTSSRPAKPGVPEKPRKLLTAAELPAPAEVFDGVGEAVWIDVIRKMDEVYNDLLQYEVALEEKNSALEASHQFIESVLSSMSACNRSMVAFAASIAASAMSTT